jgi:hypothetical protein
MNVVVFYYGKKLLVNMFETAESYDRVPCLACVSVLEVESEKASDQTEEHALSSGPLCLWYHLLHPHPFL